MIIDTSALLSILLQEPDAGKFSAAICDAPRRLVSAVSFLEASLNLGDCCSYALSQTSGEPLLFKGEDFSFSDVISC